MRHRSGCIFPRICPCCICRGRSLRACLTPFRVCWVNWVWLRVKGVGFPKKKSLFGFSLRVKRFSFMFLEVCDAADISAAVFLARCSLRVGSGIDVYHNGRFWEAEIVCVRSDSYKYRFLHTGRQREYGWVLKDDFLRQWRFPIRDKDDVWKAELIMRCVGE